jgi:hypothetical protein
MVTNIDSGGPEMRTRAEIEHEIDVLGKPMGRGAEVATDRKGVLRWVLGLVDTPPSAIVARE